MGKKRPRWKGDLAKPIYVGSIPLEATSDEEASAWIEQVIAREIMGKIPLLMRHYGIADEDDPLSLALALARDFVPGFQVVDVPLKLKHGTWGAVIRANIGRRIEWPPRRLNKLLNAVEKTKQRRGLSTDLEALEILTQREEWARPIKGSEGANEWLKTLQNRLADARHLSKVAAVQSRK